MVDNKERRILIIGSGASVQAAIESIDESQSLLVTTNDKAITNADIIAFCDQICEPGPILEKIVIPKIPKPHQDRYTKRNAMRSKW